MDGYANVIQLIPVHGERVLQGVNYVRVARDLMQLSVPMCPSITHRLHMVSAATKIDASALRRIWDGEAKSSKARQIALLLRLATANGKDVFTVPGVTEVHDHIFGVRS